MSSTDMLSWLGDPDVSLMSDDGHKVMTHRAVLGLYSSSFRHLLSVNQSGEKCALIFHSVSSDQLEETVTAAKQHFQGVYGEESEIDTNTRNKYYEEDLPYKIEHIQVLSEEVSGIGTYTKNDYEDDLPCKN